MKEIITLSHSDFGASIGFDEAHAVFRLRWTDYVANDWEDQFPSLDRALARLALLVMAVETDRTFSTGGADYATAWSIFADGQLSGERCYSVPCDRCETPIPTNNDRSPNYCDACTILVVANGGDEV